MKTLYLSIIMISLLMFGCMLNVSGTLMTPDSMIQLLVGKPTYVPGEKIQIIGSFSPNDLIHVDLVNPFDGTKNSTLLQSDNTGHFRTNYVVPYNAVNGTWKILATSGVNHASLDIQIISSNYEIKNENTTHVYGFSGGSATIIRIDSPLQQFRHGTASKDVTCRQGFQLILKAVNNSPACVKPDTAQKLAERGWTKGPRGVSALANPPVSLFNVTTSPQPIILGEPFVIKATVVNHESVPITFYGGCAFPLSASFDDSIMTYPYSTMHCLAMSKNMIEPNGTAVIYSDKMGTRYNSSGTGVTSAMLTFRYESDGKQASFTMSKQFTTSPAQTLQERWVQNKHGASPCGMPYHPQNTGMPVLFMPTNSVGKICVNYSNVNDPSTVTPRVFGAQNISQNTQDISVSPLQANVVHGNSTIVYTITSGNKTGFYGLTIFCYGTPIAVGYDNQSRIVTGDFPWLHQTFYCPLQSYNYHIVGVGGGMGIKYVPP